MNYILILLLLLIASEGRGQGIEIAHFAAQGYNKTQCKIALDGYTGIKNPTFSFLYGTFKRSGDCPKEFIRRFKNKPHSIKIYGTNETCRRGNRFCSSHKEANPGYRAANYSAALETNTGVVISGLRKRVRDLRTWIDRHTEPRTRVYVVTGLEDDFTEKAYRVVVGEYRRGLLKKDFKRVIIVRNPNGSNANNFSSRGSEFIELHALRSYFGGRRGIWSNDGYDIRFGRGYLNPSISTNSLYTYARQYSTGGYRVQIWWNTQGIERGGYLKPDHRIFNVNRGDVEVVNQLALKLQGEKND